MDLLRALLSPLTALLEAVLNIIHAVVGDYGLAIIALSVLVSLALTPITVMARRLEEKEKARQEKMAPLIAAVRAQYRGQERFEKTDEIYQQFGYHPIKAMISLLPLFVQLPFLLAALFLLTDYPPLQGEPFLFVGDLSQPDAVARVAGFPLNVLPLALTGVAIIDSWVRPEATKQSKQRFLIVALVLLVLIYPLPAAVSLYWMTSNLVSLVKSLLRKVRTPALVATS
jgi:YidC/Oxa1 family membrane protein insertase